MRPVGPFRLHIAEWDAAPGRADPRPPLVFLNGIAADIAAALPLLSRLADRPIVAVDMPGTGRSADVAAPYRIDAVAAALAEWLAATHPRYDVAGHSWGGAVAQQLALDQPGVVGRMVLIATSPAFPAPDIGTAAWADADVMSSGLRLTGASPWGMAMQYWAACGWTVAARLPALSLPVLVLTGRSDMVVPCHYGDWLARLIPGARHEQVAGAHLFAFRRAAEVAPRIAAFLDGD